MLFSKDINEITCDDIQDFCSKQIPEGINLDYKADFPRSLEKHISAFANTFGGLVIIGVDESNERPTLPCEGITYQRGLRSKVENICVTNIYPPFIPEIQVCEPVNNKTFVVIRIPQSELTPHAVAGRTQIYIRTGSSSKPEEIATVDQIEWLRNRREKAVEFKNYLVLRANERFENICSIKKCRIPFGESRFLSIPLYPQLPYIELEELRNFLLSYRQPQSDRFGYFKEIERARPLEGGIGNFFLIEKTGFVEYTEFNQFGLLFYVRDLGEYNREKITDAGTEKEVLTQKRLEYWQLLRMLSILISTSVKFYKKIGYWGLIEIKLQVKGLLGIELIGTEKPSVFDRRFPGPIDNLGIDKDLNWERTVYLNKLLDDEEGFITSLGEEVAWSMGLGNIKAEEISKVIKLVR